jgi:hypothetical protein
LEHIEEQKDGERTDLNHTRQQSATPLSNQLEAIEEEGAEQSEARSREEKGELRRCETDWREEDGKDVGQVATQVHAAGPTTSRPRSGLPPRSGKRAEASAGAHPCQQHPSHRRMDPTDQWGLAPASHPSKTVSGTSKAGGDHPLSSAQQRCGKSAETRAFEINRCPATHLTELNGGSHSSAGTSHREPKAQTT